MSTTAVLNLGLNSAQFNRDLDRSESKISSFAKMSPLLIAGMVGGIATGLGVIGFSLVKSSADADETSSKFNSVFRDLQKSSNETAKTLASDYGMSTQESQKLLGATGDLLTGFGFTQKSALSLSQTVQELASDLTSFQNFSGGVAGASDAITSALTGETEKMKALGVVVRQGTKEYQDNVKAIQKNRGVSLLQAKAIENLRIITEQSKNAIGDYVRTQNSLSNQLKLTGKIWDDLKISVGRFIAEFSDAEGIAVGFNKTFRKITNNTVGFLSNYKSNFKKLFEWIGVNASNLFVRDMPKLLSALSSNLIGNFKVILNTIGGIFNDIRPILVDIWREIWTVDFPNAMLDGLKTMGSLLAKNIHLLLNPSSFTADLITGYVIGNDEAGSAFDNLGGVISKTVDNAKLKLRELESPIDAIKNLEFKSTDIEFDLDVKDNFKDNIKDIENTLKIKDENKTSSKNIEQGLSQAVMQGSIEAQRLEKTSTRTKMIVKQLKEAKTQTTILKSIRDSETTETIVAI